MAGQDQRPLCGELAPTRLEAYAAFLERHRCTREAGHDGDHVATIGPWRPGLPELARWGRAPEAHIVGLMAAELDAKGDQVMEVQLTAATVLQLASLLRLATLHPAVPAEAGETAEQFIAAALQFFADAPMLRRSLEQGDFPVLVRWSGRPQ